MTIWHGKTVSVVFPTYNEKDSIRACCDEFFLEGVVDEIVVAEPDGTFAGRNVLKLLAYFDDFEVVYGTRTVKELIWRGANRRSSRFRSTTCGVWAIHRSRATSSSRSFWDCA
jgi:hypothetical protein